MPEHADVKAKILKEIRVKLAEFIAPLVQDMVGDIVSNMQGTGGALPGGVVGQPGSAAAIPAITPEMIRAVQDSMKQPQEPQ